MLQHTLVALDGFPVLKTRHLKIGQHPSSSIHCWGALCRTSQVALQWPSPQDLRTNEAAAQALLADETKDSDLQRDLAALPGQPRWALSRDKHPTSSNMIKSHDVTGLFVNCKMIKMMLNDAKQISRIWMIWTDVFQIYSVLLDHEIRAMMSWPKVGAVSSEVQAVWTAAYEASGSAGTSCLETQWGVTDGPFVWNGMLRSCSGCLI